MTLRAGDVLHSSVVQGSTAHSNNNPGVLYQTPHCGADINFTRVNFLHSSLGYDSWGHYLASSNHL